MPKEETDSKWKNFTNKFSKKRKQNKCETINGELKENDVCVIDNQDNKRIYGVKIEKKATFMFLDDEMKRKQVETTPEDAQKWIQANIESLKNQVTKRRGKVKIWTKDPRAMFSLNTTKIE